MIAAVINAVLVVAGGLAGVFFGRLIKPRILETIMAALAVCVMIIGITGAVRAEDLLGMIICLVIGTVIGELIRIEDRIDSLGSFIQEKIGSKSGRFTEGFLAASVLFCVGSLAIVGSIEAGLHGDYTIILSKSIIDCVTAISLAAAMGMGVVFSAVCILVYQGIITLGAEAVSGVMNATVITAMSACGGVLMIATGFNMLNLKHIRVANMLPAIFLPIAYVPLSSWLSGLI